MAGEARQEERKQGGGRRGKVGEVHGRGEAEGRKWRRLEKGG